MKIKDVIKLSALYLGRERIVRYLEGNQPTENDDVLSGVDTLTRCANIVVSELASSYIPLVKTEEITLADNFVNYSAFSETVLKIIDVKGLNGENVDYSIGIEELKANAGKVKVKYEYLPSNLGLTDNVGYTEKTVPSFILAYGVSAEFCLTEKNFDESVMWRKRFADALAVINKPKSAKVKLRRFV